MASENKQESMVVLERFGIDEPYANLPLEKYLRDMEIDKNLSEPAEESPSEHHKLVSSLRTAGMHVASMGNVRSSKYLFMNSNSGAAIHKKNIRDTPKGNPVLPPPDIRDLLMDAAENEGMTSSQKSIVSRAVEAALQLEKASHVFKKRVLAEERGAFSELYIAPPDKAPELWNEREDKDVAAVDFIKRVYELYLGCLLYTSPSPRDRQKSRMPSSA